MKVWSHMKSVGFSLLLWCTTCLNVTSVSLQYLTHETEYPPELIACSDEVNARFLIERFPSPGGFKIVYSFSEGCTRQIHTAYLERLPIERQVTIKTDPSEQPYFFVEASRFSPRSVFKNLPGTQYL